MQLIGNSHHGVTLGDYKYIQNIAKHHRVFGNITFIFTLIIVVAFICLQCFTMHIILISVCHFQIFFAHGFLAHFHLVLVNQLSLIILTDWGIFHDFHFSKNFERKKAL